MNPTSVQALEREPRERLLYLLRCALWGRPVDWTEAPDAATWTRIRQLAGTQGVTALVWEVVERLSGRLAPPREERLRWAFETRRIEQRWQRQQRCVARLAAFYARHGIRMMLLKGCGLSLDYRVPSHRPCGDVDIWLFGRQPEADALLTREWGIAVDTSKEHHTTFRLDDIPVENHYDFLNTRSSAANRRLERRLKSLAERPEESFTAGFTPVFLPPPTFGALFLLRHAAGHFAACGIGLRHLVDWTLFVVRRHDRIDWTEVERTARETGMEPFFAGLQALCVDHLGLDPALIPPFRRDPEFEERMLGALLGARMAVGIPQGRLAGISFRLRRWWRFRWMRRMVSDEPLALGFLRMTWLHVKRHLPLFVSCEAAGRRRRARGISG